MNKKLHIFLFLLFILIIFYFLKDIEPFGNQVLLQPGLSFDSRDTTIISLQENPVIDNSANTESRGNEITTSAETISTSRRLPSAVEERGEPSYAVFDDTSSNIDYLSTDFDSREEIELLNERLEELKLKSDLLLSEGAKRKCTIPRGIYNSYNIKKKGGLTNETVKEGEKYDYDYFSGLEIECVGGDEEDTKEITCEGTNEYFKFSGCKRQCEIPQGYTINGNSNGNYDYDHFNDPPTLICDNGYIQENGSPEFDGCPENLYEFQLTGCVRQCNFYPSILTGYNIGDNVNVDSINSELPENYFIDIGISCNEPNYQRGEVEPQISCNPEGIFETSGCEKRQCTIPVGYTITVGNDVYNSGSDSFDFDMFTDPDSFTLGCDDNYEGPVSMGSGGDILTCTDANEFNLNGCVRQCTIPPGHRVMQKYKENRRAGRPFAGRDRIYDEDGSMMDFSENNYITVDTVYDGTDLDYNAFLEGDGVNPDYYLTCDEGYFSYNTSVPNQNIINNLSGLTQTERSELIGPLGDDSLYRTLQRYIPSVIYSGDDSIPCSDDNNHFIVDNPCVPEKCVFDTDILDGYDIDESVYVPNVDGEELDFNHFTGKGISCVADPNYQGDDPQISCNSNGRFETSGCIKRQCTIPDDETSDGYIFTSLPGGQNRIIPNKGGLFNYDIFSTISVECNEPNYIQEDGGVPTGTCVSGNTTFQFSGCNKRQCRIPEGYKITGDDGTIYNSGSDPVNFDIPGGENLSCDNVNGYDGSASPGSEDDICTEDVFNFTGCNKRQCEIPEGYKITDDDGNEHLAGALFNHDLDGGVLTCADNYSGDAGLTAGEGLDGCQNDGELFQFTGCTKRQCEIPEGYKLTNTNNRVYNSDSDPLVFDIISLLNLDCDNDYEGRPRINDMSGEGNICIEDNNIDVFNFIGCDEKRQCTIPVDGSIVAYNVTDGNGENLTLTPGALFNYDHFSDDSTISIGCNEPNYIRGDRGTPTGTCGTEDTTFQFSGCIKRQCRIPEGYKITDTNDDNTVYKSDSGSFNFDMFTDQSRFTLECDDNYDGQVSSGSGDDICTEENVFNFSGCVRQCTIPTGYKITDRGDNDYVSGQPLDFDYFDGQAVTLGCEDNYITNSESNINSNIICPIGDNNMFSMGDFNCQEIITCNIPSDSRKSSYLISGSPIDQSSLEFNPFDGKIFLDDERNNDITCAPNYGPYQVELDPHQRREGRDRRYEYRSESGIRTGIPIPTEPSITCDENNNVVFDGCSKRQCKIPGWEEFEGYIHMGERRVSISPERVFDYDYFYGNMVCNEDIGYEQVTEPSVTCPEGGGVETSNMNYFVFSGCEKRQCSIPSSGISGDYYIIPRGRQLRTPLSEEFTSTMLRDYISEYWTMLRSQDMYNQNATLEYDHFDSLNIGCTKPGPALGGVGPNMVPGTAEITCPIGDSGETPIFEFSCN